MTRPRVAAVGRVVGALAATALTLLSAAVGVGSPAHAASEERGVLLAFDRATGAERWRVTTPGYFAVVDESRDVVVGRGTTCAGARPEYRALAAASGTTRWRSPAADDVVRGSDRVATGAQRTSVVVTRAGTGPTTRLDGRDARTGDVRWDADIPAGSNVAVDATSVVVSAYADVRAGEDARVTVLDRATGEERWSRSYADGTFIWSQVGGSSVLVTRMGDRREAVTTSAVALGDGSDRWSAAAGLVDAGPSITTVTPVTSASAGPEPLGVDVRDTRSGVSRWTSDGAVMSSDRAHALTTFREDPQAGPTYAIADARTGTEQWRLPSVGRGLRPVLSGRTVVSAAGDGDVVVADASDGTTRWRAGLPDGVGVVPATSVAVGPDTVYVAVGCTPLD